jgi:hypothetical protein
MQGMKAMVLIGLGLCSMPALAEEVPKWSGDIGIAYGRNLGQGLNIAEGAFEVKANVHPQFAAGVRIGGTLGVSVGQGSAEAFAGLPLLLKGEGFLNDKPTRPFLGLGAGVTLTSAGGAFVAADNDSASATAYGVSGPIPTLMPELGVDLNGLRLSMQYRWLLGSANSVRASVEAGTAGTGTTVDDNVPGLSGLTLSLGAHIGGPKKER